MPPAPARRGIAELLSDLEYIRAKERETGESMERQKAVVKKMIENEEKMASLRRS